MTSLALSPKTLRRLSYDVIWGLRCDIPGVKTLYEEALYLENNPAERTRIQRETEAILLAPGILGLLIRVFCWLFNWHQYRVNYYRLQGYFSLALYKQGFKMFPDFLQKRVSQEGGFRVTSPEASMMPLSDTGANEQPILTEYAHQLYTWAGNNFTWISDNVGSLLFNNQPLFETDSVEKALDFVVSESMVEHLEILGLKTAIGEIVSLDEVKKAYRKAILNTHPDHHPNSPEKADQFLQIKASHEALGLLLDHYFSPTNDPFGFKSALDTYFEKQEEEIDQLRHEFKQRGEETRRYKEQVDNYAKNADNYIQNADNYIQNADQLIHTQKEYLNILKNYNQGLKELLQMLDEEKEAELMDSQDDASIQDDALIEDTITSSLYNTQDNLNNTITETQPLMDTPQTTEPVVISGNPHTQFAHNSHCEQPPQPIQRKERGIRSLFI